jgi:L-ascorbate metabolism protein UlaG (beta-lactamase superfamily)
MTNGGEPGGFVLQIPHLNGRIYHGGDTNVFSDMKIIEDLYQPNILMIPIGDRFTMGPQGAAYAVKNFFHSAKHIIPMHYGTFPLLTGTLEEFKV